MKHPELPPLIVKKSPSAFYLYTYKNQWDSEKKRSCRVSFKKVGTIVSGTREGRIRWDEHFLEEYPELRNFVCERKGKQYVFAREDEGGLTLKQVLAVRQRHAGATWALDRIVSDSPLGAAIREIFPKQSDYLKVLSVAYFLMLNPNDNISRYPVFAESTRLPWPLPMNSAAIGGLFEGIRKQQIEEYFALVQEGLTEEGKGNADRQILALDSTPATSFLEADGDGRKDINEHDDALPQINLLMLVESKSGLPILYRHYDGNVPDAQTVRQVVSNNADLGQTDVVLVSDRGCGGNKSINDCLRNELGFLFNLNCAPGSLAQELIGEETANLRDLNNRDWFTEVSHVTRKVNWTYDRQPVAGKGVSRKDQDEVVLYWHIYFDRRIAENVRQGLVERIDRVREKLHKGSALDDNEKLLFEELFVKKEDGSSDAYFIDNRKVDEKLKFKGYWVLVSNKIADARDAWCAYQERQLAEDTFGTLKARLGSFRNGIPDCKSLTGKIFVQFIATSICMMIRSRLKTYGEEYRKHDKLLLTCEADELVLDVLNSIKQTEFKGAYYFGEIPEEKLQLFEALGVVAPNADPEPGRDYGDEPEGKPEF